MTAMLTDLVPAQLLIDMVEGGYISVREHNEDSRLRILSYTKSAQFEGEWNTATKVCRGLIVRGETLENSVVVASPWRKFFTLQQIESKWALSDEEADTVQEDALLDFDAPVSVTDKVDGCMLVLYTAPDGLPAFATKGSFHSDHAGFYTDLMRSNSTMLAEASKLLASCNDTFIFEGVSPEFQIVLPYDKPDVVLTGRVAENGVYLSTDTVSVSEWSGSRAEFFDAENLTQALMLPQRANKEGIVVRFVSDNPDKQFMVKVKYDDYLRLHHVISAGSPKALKQLIVTGAAGLSVAEAIACRHVTDLPGVKEYWDACLIPGRNPVRVALASYWDAAHQVLSDSVDTFEGIFVPGQARRDFALKVQSLDANTINPGLMFRLFGENGDAAKVRAGDIVNSILNKLDIEKLPVTIF